MLSTVNQNYPDLHLFHCCMNLGSKAQRWGKNDHQGSFGSLRQHPVESSVAYDVYIHATAFAVIGYILGFKRSVHIAT